MAGSYRKHTIKETETRRAAKKSEESDGIPVHLVCFFVLINAYVQDYLGRLHGGASHLVQLLLRLLQVRRPQLPRLLLLVRLGAMLEHVNAVLLQALGTHVRSERDPLTAGAPPPNLRPRALPPVLQHPLVFKLQHHLMLKHSVPETATLIDDLNLLQLTPTWGLFLRIAHQLLL